MRRVSEHREGLHTMLDRQTLDRMWILRKYLADMTPLEAMEFVKDRLERTKDNDEFLMSMNS